VPKEKGVRKGGGYGGYRGDKIELQGGWKGGRRRNIRRERSPGVQAA